MATPRERKGVNVVSNILSGNIGEINKKSQDKENIKAENSAEDKELFLQHFSVNFDTDTETLDYLKEQAFKIQSVTSKAYTELGKVFTETQDKLAKNGYGCFREWFEAIGFSKDMVYRLIARNNLIVAFCDKQALIEALPITLSYEISKPNCPEDLRNAVLSGEIKTSKEFNQAANNLLPLTPPEILIPENLNEIFERDIKVFSKNYATINEVLKEKLENLSDSSKKNILDEIEFLNIKMEKLIKKL